MARNPAGFRFLENTSAFRSSTGRVAAIPANLADKNKLMTTLARELAFPKYFGRNWDALEECLRDLSWVEENDRVTVLHHGLPFSKNLNDRRTYIEVLQAAGEHWKRVGGVRFVVVFPADCRDAVLEVCNARDVPEGRLAGPNSQGADACSDS